MFDIGWSELLVIAVVAILVVGPKDLPRMLRSFGQYAGKVRRMANEFRQQFDEAIRESELDELRSSVESIRDVDPMKDIKSAVADTMAPLEKAADDIRREADKPADAAPAEPARIGAAAETAPEVETAAPPPPAETATGR